MDHDLVCTIELWSTWESCESTQKLELVEAILPHFLLTLPRAPELDRALQITIYFLNGKKHRCHGPASYGVNVSRTYIT